MIFAFVGPGGTGRRVARKSRPIGMDGISDMQLQERVLFEVGGPDFEFMPKRMGI